MGFNFENMIDRMLVVETTIEVQLSIALVFATIWLIVFEIFTYFAIPWIQKQPWYQGALVIMAKQCKTLHIVQGEMSDKEYEMVLVELYAVSWACVVQHSLGGFLCFPVLLGYDTFESTGLHAYQLAMLGGLSEVGWEIYDYINRLVKREPMVMLIFFGLHHATGQLVVLPCNLNLATSWFYAAAIADLQGAAALGIAVDNYLKTLNIKNPRELKIVSILSCMHAFIMTSTRGPIYLYVAYSLIKEIIALELWGTLFLTGIGGTTMMLFNFLLIDDSCKRAFHFFNLAFTKEKVKKEDDPDKSATKPVKPSKRGSIVKNMLKRA